MNAITRTTRPAGSIKTGATPIPASIVSAIRNMTAPTTSPSNSPSTRPSRSTCPVRARSPAPSARAVWTSTPDSQASPVTIAMKVSERLAPSAATSCAPTSPTTITSVTWRIVQFRLVSMTGQASARTRRVSALTSVEKSAAGIICGTGRTLFRKGRCVMRKALLLALAYQMPGSPGDVSWAAMAELVDAQR